MNTQKETGNERKMALLLPLDATGWRELRLRWRLPLCHLFGQQRGHATRGQPIAYFGFCLWRRLGIDGL
jgi:hypothetical protein